MNQCIILAYRLINSCVGYDDRGSDYFREQHYQETFALLRYILGCGGWKLVKPQGWQWSEMSVLQKMDRLWFSMNDLNDRLYYNMF